MAPGDHARLDGQILWHTGAHRRIACLAANQFLRRSAAELDTGPDWPSSGSTIRIEVAVRGRSIG